MISFSLIDFGRDIPCVLVLFTLLAAVTTWDADALLLVAVLAVSLLSSSVLKRLLRHERPKGKRRSASGSGKGGGGGGGSCSEGRCGKFGVGFEHKRDVYGMPSSHSALSFGFFTFAGYVLVTRLLGEAKGKNLEHWQRVMGWAVTVPLFAITPFLVAYQRVHTRCHTVPQVVAGGLLGVAIGSAAIVLSRAAIVTD
jgi:hypothetical protein